MNRIECPGLDGANPLHFLASLGVLRLLDRSYECVRMGWHQGGSSWQPFIEFPGGTLESVSSALSKWLTELAKTASPDPQQERQARDLSAAIKKRDVERKNRAKALETALKGKGKPKEIKQAIAENLKDFDDETATHREELAQIQLKVGDSLGSGVAHLGDIICVNPDLFRAKAVSALQKWYGADKAPAPCVADPYLVASMFAALACDQIYEAGKLIPTPFSFSNGASGQCLLKDFRGCAAVSTPAAVRGTLTGQPVRSDAVTGLNWNPADQRSYALQWKDPQKDITEDPAIQALAYLGLSFMTAIPTGNLGAVAWVRSRSEKGFKWPIWEVPCSVDGVASLLAHMGQSGTGARPGIAELRFSEVVNPTGKRNFFAPSRSL